MSYNLREKFLKKLKEPFYPIIRRGSHAEVCPICHGRGTIEVGGTCWNKQYKTCHGCGGKGWVTVYD